MKKLLFLLIVLFTCLSMKAQEATTDYIYSSDGFEVKKGVITIFYGNAENTYISRGLYSKDGKVLVAAMSNNGVFYVIEGCETIASGAFQSQTGTTVFIPSSVRYIAPDAIISRSSYSGQTVTNSFGGVVDGCKEEVNSSSSNEAAVDPDATEEMRYNVNGVRLAKPVNGINIVQMSDGSAKKELVK